MGPQNTRGRGQRTPVSKASSRKACLNVDPMQKNNFSKWANPTRMFSII